MTNWVGRARRWSGLWLAAVLAVSGAAGHPPQVSAEGNCAVGDRIFAVDSHAGHLVEIPSCPDTSSLGSAVEVDSADWRGYSTIFAVRDGGAVILYAVTATGELWWRRQQAAGAALGSPVRVGSSVNWSQPVVFASQPGYLHIGAHGAPIRTFRHQEWASGGTVVSEQTNLFAPLLGPPIAGLASSSGFAVGIWNGMNFRVWRTVSRTTRIDQDTWYLSGHLPAGVTGVVGDGYWLYAVSSAGEVVLMSQISGGASCGYQDTRPWEVTARAPGNYVRVVGPVRDSHTGPPAVPPPPTTSVTDCIASGEGNPWEWQTIGP